MDPVELRGKTSTGVLQETSQPYRSLDRSLEGTVSEYCDFLLGLRALILSQQLDLKFNFFHSTGPLK